jgi:adenylate cyclase
MATDLRGFTNLSDRLPAGELIGLLDDYFDAVVSPIHAGGGEVLKFVGDGLLAIFAPDAGKAAEAAGAALDAAVDALARLDTLNEVRQTDGRRMIRIGIGLHVGTVTYGNVGAVDRLDFTAIGPAVNLVCRLESLTKRIARPLLVSHEFAAICPRPLESLGFQPVRGFGEPEEVFGLPVLAPA